MPSEELNARRTTRELRAGFRIATGSVLTAGVVGDIKRGATDELQRAVDPAETLRGMQRLFDVFWRIGRCPVVIVEDTDHWGGTPELADAFFDQTARALATMDAVTVVAAQNDYTKLDGYQRLRDRMTAEISLPQLPDIEHGLTEVLQRRITSAGVDASLDMVLESDAMERLAQSYAESLSDGQAGDLRRTLSVMRGALDIALGEPTAELVGPGHMQEAVAKTPLAPSSALRSPVYR